MKSLVRINKKAREPGTPNYIEAVSEFTKKMGGINKILGSLMERDGDSTFYAAIASDKDPILRCAPQENVHTSM